MLSHTTWLSHQWFSWQRSIPRQDWAYADCAQSCWHPSWLPRAPLLLLFMPNASAWAATKRCSRNATLNVGSSKDWQLQQMTLERVHRCTCVLNRDGWLKPTRHCPAPVACRAFLAPPKPLPEFMRVGAAGRTPAQQLWGCSTPQDLLSLQRSGPSYRDYRHLCYSPGS